MDLNINLPGTPPRVSRVMIGDGLGARLPRTLSSFLKGRTDFWICDESVWSIWHERLAQWGWPEPGGGRVLLFAASEANKRLSALEDLAGRLVHAGADRGSALIAVGGGVTGDVTGFLASIFMRGIPHFQVPTTLLAQVDSSIGGKTGVDLAEGKNLLGTFHQPDVILMDPAFLETLPAEEFRQGMAEIVKTAMIGDAELWEYLEVHTDALVRHDREPLEYVITACCRLKARVVEADERESGARRLLNLGHTVGHALEKLSDYRVRHGDGVAVGMVAAARWAVRLGRLPQDVLTRLERLCTAWDLPVRISPAFSPDEILDAVHADKKRIGETLHFILPAGVGWADDCVGLDLAGLKEVLVGMRE